MKTYITGTIGYPRIGHQRQMKWALEKYWAGKISLSELKNVSFEVSEQSVKEQFESGINLVGVGSHTMYDHILDWTMRFGIIPKRFKDLQSDLNLSKEDLYFAMARGKNQVHALDMTKWFDTNYHNITPEIDHTNLKNAKPDFSDYFVLIEQAIKIIGEKSISAEIIGPLTFAQKSILDGLSISQVVSGLKHAYNQFFKAIDSYNLAEIQIHEPALVLEQFHTQEIQILLTEWYASHEVNTPINLVTYFDDIGEAFPWLSNLASISTLSLDFTRGDNISLIKKYGWPDDKILGAGIIDGRSVWHDQSIAMPILLELTQIVRNKNMLKLQPSCSFMFLPIDVEYETHLDAYLKQNLKFSKQKLKDLVSLASLDFSSPVAAQDKKADKTVNLAPELFIRSLSVKERRHLQLTGLSGQKLVTSTIGSFPQTSEMRKIRLQHRKGLVSDSEYHKAVDQYIAYCIGAQEGIGLDILVHGEPERSDMVEYFAEKMEGFLFTINGWVQSYGSRYVRPPVIHSDIKRKANQSITVREYLEAAKHTSLYVKGMLTGPTTIINWSFPRKDISKKEQTFQVALALREEICDLESNGCKVIQVDEPALREGLPLKCSKQTQYLATAVDAFRLTTAVAQPSTHIVTHFCYSEFGDIIDSIKAMDADQITIENSRSDNAMLKAFAAAGFENFIAPGIYDVHSPVVPSIPSLKARLHSFLQSGIPLENIMIVPDCGLKTRKWDEVIKSLRNVVLAVDEVRQDYS